MLYAFDAIGNLVEAQTSGQRGVCPCCGDQVVARCGRINVWHWAHRRGPDCDKWSEPISDWHRDWQRYLLSLGAKLESTVQVAGIRHRADAVMPSGLVVELQHSAISIDEIRQRERFYKRMIWVFDVREAYAMNRLSIRDQGGYATFRWKHPRRSIAYAIAPVRLDLGGGEIFRLKAMHDDSPCGGWGKWAYVAALDRDNK